jgi:hypothetical protein
MIFFKPMLAAMLLLALSGCAVLEKIESSPMTSQLITNQITLRFIAGSDDPVQRAANVRDVVEKVRGQVSADKSFTLAGLDEAVRAEIDWQALSAMDQELLNFGLAKANAAIAELIGDGVIDPAGMATVATLLTWIDQAAQRVR